MAVTACSPLLAELPKAVGTNMQPDGPRLPWRCNMLYSHDSLYFCCVIAIYGTTQYDQYVR